MYNKEYLLQQINLMGDKLFLKILRAINIIDFVLNFIVKTGARVIA